MNYPGEEKSREYYMEAFETEAKGKVDFYKKDIEIRNRNIKKLTNELEEENTAKRASEAEIAALELRLGDIDKEAKRLLFRDFRAAVNEVLNGQESQSGGRYGLRIERQGPFKIERPVSVNQDGKRIVEMREVSIMKFRNNESALERFRDYLRQAGNIPLDELTFDELREAIERFFHDASRPDVYGEPFEEELAVPDNEAALFNRFDEIQNGIKSGDSLFRY